MFFLPRYIFLVAFFFLVSFFIVVKETTTVEGDDDNKERDKKLSFKNNAPFRLCISKINYTFTDNAEDFNTVMLMYNMLEYSDNHFMKSGSLSNDYRNEINVDANENNTVNNRIDNNKTITSKLLEYETELMGSTPNNNNNNNNNNILDEKGFVLLKCFSIVWRSLDLPLINCEIELNLSLDTNNI